VDRRSFLTGAGAAIAVFALPKLPAWATPESKEVRVQRMLDEAKPGSTVVIPPDTYRLEHPWILRVSRVKVTLENSVVHVIGNDRLGDYSGLSGVLLVAPEAVNTYLYFSFCHFYYPLYAPL